MTYMIILWILMLVFWVLIVSRQRKKVRNSKNHIGETNDYYTSQKVEVGTTHFEKNNRNKTQKESHKSFEDAGLVDDNEYDIRDL